MWNTASQQLLSSLFLMRRLKDMVSLMEPKWKRMSTRSTDWLKNQLLKMRQAIWLSWDVMFSLRIFSNILKTPSLEWVVKFNWPMHYLNWTAFTARYLPENPMISVTGLTGWKLHLNLQWMILKPRMIF